MKPLAAILCPPLYFLIQGRPLASIVHFFFWCLAIVTAVIGIGIFIWFVQASLACWDLRKQVMDEQATAIAKRMAEVMPQAERSAVNEK